MPATCDYWVNDRSGDPLLVITGEVNTALTKALPNLLRQVRGVVGERRVTIVFDRGGWSPKLFRAMLADDFDILDGYVGPGYGQSYPEVHATIRRVARKEAVLLDPVYTGKAAAGLLDLIHKGHFKKGEKVLFLHTGGSPGLYAYQDVILD